MSKHIARLIVTVIILGILGYVGYTYFFSPDINMHVYDKTLSLASNSMSENSIYNNFKKLEEKNYYGTDKDNVISNTQNQIIAFNVRQILFDLESVDKPFQHKALVGNSEGDVGLAALVNELNSTTMFYLTHAQFAENVNKSDVEDFNRALKRLTQSTKEINEDITTLLARQNRDETNTALYNQINTSYSNLLNKVVNHAKLQAEFLKELKNFVVENVYNGNFIFETNAILHNALIYTTLNLNNEITEEEMIKLVYETMLIVSSTTTYKNTVQSSQPVVDNDLVRYYNDIISERPQLLFGGKQTNIFSFSYENKLNLSEDGAFESIVAIKHQDNVQYIFKALGY